MTQYTCLYFIYCYYNYCYCYYYYKLLLLLLLLLDYYQGPTAKSETAQVKVHASSRGLRLAMVHQERWRGDRP
jgi:hypothetical protein